MSDRIAAHTPRWLDIPWLGGIKVAPWFILGTIAVLLTATLGSLYVSNHPDRLDYGTRAFHISDRQAELTFDVEKSPSAVAQCSVDALSLDSAVVGRKTGVVVGPALDGRHTTTVSVVVPTSERATAVEIEDCWITRKG
jgi:hypothetical protein